MLSPAPEETVDEGGLAYSFLSQHHQPQRGPPLSLDSLSLTANIGKSNEITNLLFYWSFVFLALADTTNVRCCLTFLWYDRIRAMTVFGFVKTVVVVEDDAAAVCRGSMFDIITRVCTTFLIGVFVLLTFPIIQAYQR